MDFQNFNNHIPQKRLKVPQVKLLDKLHRAFVYTCVGVSGVGIIICGILGANYFINIRPEIKREYLQKNQELLEEGAALEINEIPQVS